MLVINYIILKYLLKNKCNHLYIYFILSNIF